MDLETVLLGSSYPLERCLRQIGTPYRKADLGDSVPGSCAVYLVATDSESCRKKVAELLKKKKAVVVPEGMRRHLEVTPLLFSFPDAYLIPQFGSIPKTFRVGELFPKEEVAVRSTNPMVLFFLRLLTQIYEKQGLFFPALSFYPFGYRSLFSFRVDADEYDAPVCEAFFDKAAKYCRGTSVFFSAANFQEASLLIKQCGIAGFEVQSHSFYHYTYRSPCQNRYNIRKAADFLKTLGISPKGFAAPHGRWNQGLQSVLEESGYTFSSDFAYDYDGFPSFPFGPMGFSKVLQVPVHPVCSGVCLQAAKGSLTGRDLEPYFESIFERKYQRCEPIIFYDHPTPWITSQFSLIDRWFAMAHSASGVWICQLGEFAAWWMQRERLELKVSQEPYTSCIEVSCASLPQAQKPYAVNLYRKGSEEYAQVLLTQAPSFCDLENAVFNLRPASGEKNNDDGIPVPDSSGFRSLKKFIKRTFDWETVTPVNEIIAEDLGGFLKKIARSISPMISSSVDRRLRQTNE